MLNLAKVFFSSLLGLLKSEIVERHSKDKLTISINGTVERVTHLKLARLSNIIISGKELCSRVNLFLYLRCRNILLLGSDYCLHIYSEGLMSKIFARLIFEFLNNPDNLKHNGITIDSEFLTQEPITIPSNGSAVSIDETGSGSKWQDFKDSFKRVKPIEVDPNLSEAEKWLSSLPKLH
ncbi:BDM_1a_G0000810.mRNA.1.CDS.1 [Saccharomyces cerevisiae]|nr:BDM_1a_G0000810.mRNA.1.CDS.1 [Saccharomyces cerevisiae]CAI7036060.1 BDM_1a_G0000810.mRNA.1.CDS.1 [Saccharomyces cerevisiae]